MTEVMEELEKPVDTDEANTRIVLFRKAADWLSIKISHASKRQVEIFRALFGFLTFGFASRITNDFTNDEYVSGIRLITVTILTILFAATYLLEYANEQAKIRVKKSDLRHREEAEDQANKFNYLKEMQIYALHKWIPTIADDSTKLAVFQSLGNLLQITSIVDVKRDLAVATHFIQESMMKFAESVEDMKDDLFGKVKELAPRIKKNADADALESQITTNLEKKGKELDKIDTAVE